VWHLDTGKELFVAGEHTAPITALVLLPESGVVVSASWDKTLLAWDVTRDRPLGIIAELPEPVIAIARDADHNALVASVRSGDLHRVSLPETLRPATVKRRGRAISAGKPPLPAQRVDVVQFSVTTPESVKPDETFLVKVWAHLERQRSEVLARARSELTDRDTLAASGEAALLPRGCRLTVRLTIAGFEVTRTSGAILWTGLIGTTAFPVHVPPSLKLGNHAGDASVFLDGILISTTYFTVCVGSVVAAAGQRHVRVSKAFASYSRRDTDLVLTWIQGFQRLQPGVTVFLDRKDLDTGTNWWDELCRNIDISDVFLLFWSGNAAHSTHVEQEWKYAKRRRGLDFIEPCPLVDPQSVPPPAALSSKHFDHWTTAYRWRPDVVATATGNMEGEHRG
jgi:TIR domain